MSVLTSWGGRTSQPWRISAPDRTSALMLPERYLAVGAHRSYGDVGLISDGEAIRTENLKRIIDFDETLGLLQCETGLTIEEVQAYLNKKGWTLPVMPGTQFVTVGGAIANDVHGKNHHRRGSFGNHVAALTLLSSEGLCHLDESTGPERFHATIGGLGLTGLILDATLRVERLESQWLRRTTTTFTTPDALIEGLAAADEQFEFTAAWLDCSRGEGVRGYIDCAEYSDNPRSKGSGKPSHSWTVPSLAHLPLINPTTIRRFNALHFALAKRRTRPNQPVRMQNYLFPLDKLHHWNRLYGRRGFFQFQGVLPFKQSLSECTDHFETMIGHIRHSGLGSPLVVIKAFGSQPAAGMLSYPRPGLNIAIDLLNRPGVATLHRQLENIILNAGGAIYPAKDALMQPHTFRQGYPAFDDFTRFKDPATTSAFWSRMTRP